MTPSRTRSEVALRPARPEDVPFLHRVYAGTRTEEMALTGWEPARVEAFLRMQFTARCRSYEAQFPEAESSVVLRGGAPVGLLLVDRPAAEVHVIDVALLPEHRGAGIGSELMRRLMAEAATRGVPVRLHVESFNRALRWYERLGFRAVGQTGVHVELVWRAESAAAGG